MNRWQAFLIGVFDLFLRGTRVFDLRKLESIKVHEAKFIKNMIQVPLFLNFLKTRTSRGGSGVCISKAKNFVKSAKS